MKKDLLYITTAFILFAGLKIAYPYIGTDYLKPLLFPVSKVMEIMMGTASVYNNAHGYFFPMLNITIDRSCSGFNFFLISFLMICFVLTRHNRFTNLHTIPVSLLLAYIITLLANISRISSYLMIMNTGFYSSYASGLVWLHQTQGIFVYLSFLVFTYWILNFVINKFLHNNEEATQS